MYIGLGTNVGDRQANLAAAVEQLASVLQISAASSIYETDPLGFADQARFWNMVLHGKTMLPPQQLLDQLLAIEQDMGRRRSFRNAPRIIDLDILLYDDVVLDVAGLTLPHPRMTERAFVLQPLLEITPDLMHPVTGEAFRDVLARGEFERPEVVAPPLFG